MGALGLHFVTLFMQPQRLRESEVASYQPYSPHAALVPSAQLPSRKCANLGCTNGTFSRNPKLPLDDPDLIWRDRILASGLSLAGRF